MMRVVVKGVMMVMTVVDVDKEGGKVERLVSDRLTDNLILLLGCSITIRIH